MGSGHWSTDVYAARASYRASTGASAFAYSDGGATRSTPTSTRSASPRGRAGTPATTPSRSRSACCST